MCEVTGESTHEVRNARPIRVIGLDGAMAIARELARRPEMRTTHVGFVGYGRTSLGQKVLIAVDREYDPAVPETIAAALREQGAKVDILYTDLGQPEQEFGELDEIEVSIRREPWERNPRRWEGLPFVEEFAARRGYDLLIHGKGGPIPKTDFRYEAIPWLRLEHFLQPATVFPLDLHLQINEKVWQVIWKKGRGGRARLTDPEGTDLTWTYWEEYFDQTRYGFEETPRYGHLFAHPTPPLLSKADARGVVAGTTSHFGRPFPRIRLEVEDGQVVRIEGGGGYGRAWEQLREETRHIHYPVYPRPGLFFLWEVAIGTNPKIRRPSNVHQHGSGGFEWERRRSGIIHLGFGTTWRGPEERWAAERGIVYGHLHVHLLFPTLVVYDKRGYEYPLIRDGRLLALDDPGIRGLAAKFGDPDELLREDWIPRVPGINAPGSYDDYAKDPASWLYAR